MGRPKLLPLMMSLVLLAGCGRGATERSAEEHAIDLQRQWRDMTACSCHLALTADYGERVFSCEMDMAYDQVTGGVFTLTQPDLVRGISARVKGDDLSLSYDGTSLETGPLTDEGLSPLEAAPTLYRQLTQGNLSSWELADGVLTLAFRGYDTQPGEGLEATVSFNAETDEPLTGRLSWNGTQIIEIQATNFQMMTGEAPEGS